MTTITAAFLSSLSGMRAAQAGLAVTSQNIANASTPGYVRSEITLAPSPALGSIGGVEISGVRRAADQFLAFAGHVSEAARGASAVRADFLDRLQASFGDPTQGPNLFASLDEFWSVLSSVVLDPTSTVRRSEALSALQAMFGDVKRIGGIAQELITEADARIADRVSEAQDLINQITDLNKEINWNRRSGADVTGAENAQAALIDKLSTLIDIRVSGAPDGGVHVRTTAGALLVGVDPAQISYTPTEALFATHGFITLNPQLGTATNLEPMLLSGEIRGLIDARDKDLAGLAEALGGFAGALADTLNRVHNDNTASPPPSQFIGRQTGLLGGDALNFTGEATIGVVNSSGALSGRLAIDFDAGTITSNAPLVYNFTNSIGSFAAALNTALAAATPAGSASFNNGVLSLNVGAGGGLIAQQSTTDPAQRAGRGFSHFFGLNDLASRPTPIFFEAGMSGTDLHGLTAGSGLSYEVRDSAGRLAAQRTVTISGALAGAASTVNDLVAALNANTTGLGGYATFAVDPQTGRVQMTPTGGYVVTLTGDSTTRGATGVSFSALNGLSIASTQARAVEIGVNPRINANSTLLAVGEADLSVAIGQRPVEGGDARGASALAAVRTTVIQFPGAGGLPAQSVSISNLASRLGGEAGRQAVEAKRNADAAETMANAAADRRGNAEGVNVDDEMLRMTQYQNAYAAAARVIQAATEMLDILMAIGLRR